MPDAAAGFSSSAVLPVLHEACHQAGLSSSHAELLRLGENAIYRLAVDPVVVRIARSATGSPEWNGSCASPGGWQPRTSQRSV